MRPRLFTDDKAKNVWWLLCVRKGKTPTVAQYAKALGGVSTRTAWRYMKAYQPRKKCVCCKGTGWVDNLSTAPERSA